MSQNYRIKDTTQIRVPIYDYDGAPLSLEDQFPVGYLAGSTVKDAILHDPNFVSKQLSDHKVALKYDSIHFLNEHIYTKNRNGNKNKGF